MDIKLKCLGGGNEVGRSAFVVKAKERILLDYGVKLHTKDRIPEYPLKESVDYAVISHAHLDHIGALPSLFVGNKVEWYSTPPTYEIGEIMWEDSIKLAKINKHRIPFSKYEVNKAYKSWNPLIYGVRQELGNFEIELSDASHIAGSSMVSLYIKDKKILYTGDFKMEKTEMHDGAKYEKADVLIIEGTYWDQDHPKREEIEKELIERIRLTIENGGNVLLPSFALGRTQEMIKVIRKYEKEIPVYVDGMGKRITRTYLKYPGFFRDFVGFERAVKSVRFVEKHTQREKALREPSVIISTAGMLEGGPAMYYLTRLNPNSEVIITGYCVEETNGRRLLEKGQVEIDGYELDIDLEVRQLDFSAHAGRGELLKFIEKSCAEKVIIVHSENSEGFVQELKQKGFDAKSISVGEEISI